MTDGTRLYFAEDITINRTTLKCFSVADQSAIPSRNINLGAGHWLAGANAGTLMWAIDRDTDVANAFRSGATATVSEPGSNISLLAGKQYSSAASDGIHLWVVSNDENKAYAWTVAGVRAADKDIDLPNNRDWDAATGIGGKLWFHDNEDNQAYCYDASLLARDSSYDLIISGDVVGMAATENIIWAYRNGGGSNIRDWVNAYGNPAGKRVRVTINGVKYEQGVGSATHIISGLTATTQIIVEIDDSAPNGSVVFAY